MANSCARVDLVGSGHTNQAGAADSLVDLDLRQRLLEPGDLHDFNARNLEF